jgi:hypothetical protein
MNERATRKCVKKGDTVMDFLVCQCAPLGVSVFIALENIESNEAAISKANDIALGTKEGSVVGLFTRAADPICGWKVLKDGKLRSEPVDMLQCRCSVGSGSYDFARAQGDKIKQARKNKQQ